MEVALLGYASSLEIGSRVGPYEVCGHLGGGGMATVYKAWHTGLERFEALKIPHSHNAPGFESDFVQRLLDEARTAAGLHHPHIVAIHNVSEAGAAMPFFAMDLVEGLDLQKLIAQRGHLELGETVQILRQVGAALDYAHARGVIHRDIKPANILLHDGRPGEYWAKVVDFGISRAVEDPGGTRLTASDLFVGTPEYMSPEQSGSGAAIDYRTDIYSLGIVAYEMLCGQPPFVAGEGVSRISVIVKHISQPPPPLTQHLADLPFAINDVILKALAKDPHERYQSCAEFVDALDAAQQRSALSATPPVFALPPFVQTEGQPIAPAKTKAADQDAPTPLWGRQEPARRGLPQNKKTVAARPASLRALFLATLGGMIGATLLIFGFVAPHVRNGDALHTSALTMTSAGAQEGAALKAVPTVKAVPSVSSKPTGKSPTRAVTAKKVVKPPTTGPIRVIRSRRRIPLAFPKQTRKNAWIPQGQRRIKQRGVKGIKEELIVTKMRGEQRISSRVVKAWLVKRPIAEIQLIGTAPAAKSRSAAKARSNITTKSSSKKPVIEKIAAKKSPRKAAQKPAAKKPTRKAPSTKSKGRSVAHSSKKRSSRSRSSRSYSSKRRLRSRQHRPTRLIVPIR